MSKATTEIQPEGHRVGAIKPIAVTFPDGKKLTGLGQSTLWKLVAEGKLRVARPGRRTLLIYEDLERLIHSSLSETPRQKTPDRWAMARAAKAASTKPATA